MPKKLLPQSWESRFLNSRYPTHLDLSRRYFKSWTIHPSQWCRRESPESIGVQCRSLSIVTIMRWLAGGAISRLNEEIERIAGKLERRAVSRRSSASVETAVSGRGVRDNSTKKQYEEAFDGSRYSNWLPTLEQRVEIFTWIRISRITDLAEDGCRENPFVVSARKRDVKWTSLRREVPRDRWANNLRWQEKERGSLPRFAGYNARSHERERESRNVLYLLLDVNARARAHVHMHIYMVKIVARS